MNKTIIYVIVAVVVIAGGFYFLNGYIYSEKQAVLGLNEKNAEYIIAGERVKLEDGLAESEITSDSTGSPQAGSASKIITKYFGNEVRKDLNDDGREDVVFLLTQETGGSGVFYYVVAALNTEDGYVGSEAVLLGDRIAPQTTHMSQDPFHNNVIVVNYADRAAEDPMTARPSIGKSIWIKLDPVAMQFGHVEQDFSGEADPSRMTLVMKDWEWVRAVYSSGREILPRQAGRFKLMFSDDGTFSASTDCNGIGGEYTAEDGTILFERMMSTLMYCDGSQEAEFHALLENAEEYYFTGRGELILDLKSIGGLAVFR